MGEMYYQDEKNQCDANQDCIELKCDTFWMLLKNLKLEKGRNYEKF